MGRRWRPPELGLATPIVPAATLPPPPPNIVLILADDLGCGYLVFFGAQCARTPTWIAWQRRPPGRIPVGP